MSDPILWPALQQVKAALVAECNRIPKDEVPRRNPDVARPGSAERWLLPGAPAHYRLVPGTEAVFELSATSDICCEGVAWARVTSVYPTREFPQQQDGWEPNAPVSWAVALELGIARCSGLMAPDPANPDIPVPDEQYDFAVQVMTNDAAALRRVGPYLVSTYSSLVIDYVDGASEPLAIQGNCSGWMHLLTIQLHAVDGSMI